MDPEIDLANVMDEENVNAASALIEVAAMSRVGMLSAGADLTEKRAIQMERDADLMETRGKVERAQHLRTNAVHLREASAGITRQREKEQIRPLVASASESILQGRATAEGKGKAGLKVSLVDNQGNVLARTVSGANGAFLLTQKGEAKTGTVVIEDVDGKLLGEVATPKLTVAKSRFMELPVETLKPVRNTPVKDPKNPKEPKQNVPKLVGLELTKALKADMSGISLGAISLVYEPDQAGRVIKQDPEAGTAASAGGSIKLVVATGEDKADFVTAQTLIRADPRVAKAEIKPAQITTLEKRLKLKSVQGIAELDEEKLQGSLKDATDAVRATANIYFEVAADVAKRFPSKG